MIQLYKSTKPNHGLVRVRKRWFLVFREDGIQRRMALGTDDEATARANRDAAYATLLANGATFRDKKPGRPKIFTGTLPEGVSFRNPWQAKVGGRSLGYFPTMADAEARVRGYLLENPKP